MSLYTRFLAITILLISGCTSPESEVVEIPETDLQVLEIISADDLLNMALSRLIAYADSIEEVLRPVPLLTPSQAAAFNRYQNPQHLTAARRLGVAQPVTPEDIHSYLTSGRLVELTDSEYWSIRRLDYSSPFVIPDVVALLEEIGQRFQSRIGEMGLPPLRLEITSVLRSQDDQARLRRVNPNAARGESTHQYGTTVDIAYSSFRAPLESQISHDISEHPWLEDPLDRIERLAAEVGAARMSRELQAILGHVLREMQNEGLVMVTMEIGQPVYHITVARNISS